MSSENVSIHWFLDYKSNFTQIIIDLKNYLMGLNKDPIS